MLTAAALAMLWGLAGAEPAGTSVAQPPIRPQVAGPSAAKSGDDDDDDDDENCAAKPKCQEAKKSDSDDDAPSRETGKASKPEVVASPDQPSPSSAAASKQADDDDADEAKNSQSEEAKTAYEDKQFFRAWRLAPAAYPELQGIEAPRLNIDTAYENRTGDAESTPASGVGTLVRLSVNNGIDVYRLEADVFHLTSSKFDSNTPALTQLSPASRLDAVQPSLFWERQNDWWPSIELGVTPVGGVLGPTFQGRFSITAPVTDDLKIPIEISRTSVADSILSYTGGKDPATGRTFGRVTESAIKIKLDYSIGEQWSVNLSESAGVRTGQDVLDNFHENIEAGLAYAFKLPGFSTFSVGPEYEFDHFDHDQEAPFLGNGGYYSPESLNRISLDVTFQTPEGKRWLISGDVAPGVQREHQFGSSASVGAALSSDVAASYRLTENASVGAILHADDSRQYGDYYFGIGFRFSLDRRSSVLSIDLPKSPFRD